MTDLIQSVALLVIAVVQVMQARRLTKLSMHTIEVDGYLSRRIIVANERIDALREHCGLEVFTPKENQ